MQLSGSAIVWVVRIALVINAVCATLLTGSGVVEVAVSWTLWAVLLVAVLVPSPASLLALRGTAPANLGVMIVLAVGNSADRAHHGWLAGVGIVAAAAILALAMSAELGRRFVQASAYGAEQRFPLRLPAMMLAPVGLAWALWTALVVGAAAMADHWPVAAALGAATVALGWWAWTRTIPFVNRWLVILPTSVVVHDVVVLAETLMLARRTIAATGLALVDTQAFDLTGPAGGRAVEITAREAATVVLRGTKADPAGRAVHARAVLVAPSRPGAALHALTTR